MKKNKKKRNFKQLTLIQRLEIEAYFNKFKCTHKEIAKKIGVSKSTISRELKRNTINGLYCHKRAEELSIERKKMANANKNKISSDVLNEAINCLIKYQWSPVQISGKLKRDKNLNISHETIYKYIWKNRENDGDWYKNLRHRGKKYIKKNSSKSKIKNRVELSKRPEIVKTKTRFGDWELDTVIGKRNQKEVLLTLVERKTKFTLVRRIETRRSEIVSSTIIDIFKNQVVETMTSDNGLEFAKHEEISKKLNSLFFFAPPYSAYERGLNEHTNGLIRQYIPKSTPIKYYSHEKIAEIQELINNRPRKILNFKTPKEAYLEEMEKRKCN
jgi:IS30 family transposase